MVHLKSNQIIGGKKKIAAETGIPETTVYRALKKLQMLGSIDIQVNHNFSVITIVNWEDYQGSKENVNHKKTTNGLKTNHKRTANEPRTDTIYKNIEYKNKELKNIESISDKSLTPPKKEHFVPPTVEEVREYCAERMNAIDPEKFVDYYEAVGWRVGKASMKNWKAAVRTWERREDVRKSQSDDGWDYLYSLAGEAK